jgi:hypothetical protein
MAARKPGSVAAPVKQKLRKNHGPKRHLFKEYKPMVRAMANAGLLTKYNNYESFVLSCGARGVRNNTAALWEEFQYLPYDKQKEFLKNLKENAQRIDAKIAKKNAKVSG